MTHREINDCHGCVEVSDAARGCLGFEDRCISLHTLSLRAKARVAQAPHASTKTIEEQSTAQIGRASCRERVSQLV